MPLSPRPSGTQAFDRAIDLLFSIAEAQEPPRLTDLAASSGLSIATTHRLLQGLTRRGLVDALPDSKRFTLGLQFFSLAARSHASANLATLARPAVLRLAAATGDCVFLMARSGFDAICLDRQDGDYTIRTLTGGIGGTTPLGLGPGSLIILSYLPEAERQVLLAHNAPRIQQMGGEPPNEARTADVRRDGFVLDAGPVLPDVIGLAVPLRSRRGTALGSLGLGAITQRLPQARMTEVLGLLRLEAAAIESALVVQPLTRQEES
jgi:DNA-binding IclR family transcriptional regulator